MTLTDVHSDPRLMADMLGIPFEPSTVYDHGCSYGYGKARPREVPAEETAINALKNYRETMRDEWAHSPHNPYKWQTRTQFVAECLREGLGIRQRGTVAERIAHARLTRPDLYQAVESGE